MGINYNELLDYTNVKINGDTSKVDEIIEYQEVLFEISKSLKEYRKEKRLSQSKLAKLLNIDQAMVSKLESGDYNPTFKQLHKISRSLTDSSNLFIVILQNIICKLSKMYKIDYKTTITEGKFSGNNTNNILYISDYKEKIIGGNYENRECTSPISIAG